MTSLAELRRLARLAVATIVVGVLTGLAVLLLVWVLHTLEHAVWGHEPGPFLDRLATPEPWKRFVGVTSAGVLAALAWYGLRRWGRKVPSVAQGVSGREMPAWETLADTVVQVSAVGLGGSLGKEVAPRELAAMLTSKAVRWFGLERRWVRVLIAAAAGGGLGAVYNVPLAGALFALEILLVEFGPRVAVPALLVSGIATIVARPLVGDVVLYDVGEVTASGSLLVAAVLIGPVMGFAGTWFTQGARYVSARRPTGWRILVVMPAIFAGVGLLGMFFPLLLGNGRALAQAAVDFAEPAWMLLVLAVLKYIATTATLGSGAVGGTLQPSVAAGAALGAAAAMAWSMVWPGAGTTELAIVGAAAFLTANLRAPLTAIALMLEFTGTGLGLLLPIVLAVGGSFATSWALTDGPARRGLSWASL